ncbi:MFS transporter [Rhizocola hellebori]|nr:MFS transporter [Rhizocola hellebori]
MTQAASVTRHSVAALTAFGALILATFCFVTSENLPAGLLPFIAEDLHSSLSAVGLLVTGYGLTVAVVSVPLTRATRAIPRRALLSGLLAVFVAASLGSTLAPTIEWLMVTRVVSALTHAVFWAVALITAAGLFSPQVRGRVVSAVFGASSVATVLGVPAGTWLGERAGWRSAFLVLTCLGVLALAAIVTLLPNTPAGQGHAEHAAEPDRRRYAILLIGTGLAIAGLSAATTYTVPFLLQVSHFSGDAIGPLLFLRGLAGIAAMAVAGVLLDRRPHQALVVPTALLALALFSLFALGADPIVAAVAMAVSGAAMFMMIAALANRVLQVAPGSTDIASAGFSAVFNVSIAAGAAIGAVLLPALGVRSTALAAAILTAGAAALLARYP